MWIVGAFDSRTLAVMNAALDSVCRQVARGEDYSVRKRVARRIIRCAHGGKTTLAELTIAGQRGLIAVVSSASRAASSSEAPD
jgi:hypothetical protein